MNLDRKFILDPKLVPFLNNVEPDCSTHFSQLINQTIDVADIWLGKHVQELVRPTGTELAVYIGSPKCTLTKTTDSNGFNLQLARINDSCPGTFFKDYKDLIAKSSSSHDKPLPSDVRFTKFMISRYELDIKAGLVYPNNGNHLIKVFKTFVSRHYKLDLIDPKMGTLTVPLNLSPLIYQ